MVAVRIFSLPRKLFATCASIDGVAGPQVRSLAGSDLWYAVAHVEPVGTLHSFYYMINGANFGGRLDLPAFRSLSYLQPGVPSGTLSAENSCTPAKSTTA